MVSLFHSAIIHSVPVLLIFIAANNCPCFSTVKLYIINMIQVRIANSISAFISNSVILSILFTVPAMMNAIIASTKYPVVIQFFIQAVHASFSAQSIVHYCCCCFINSSICHLFSLSSLVALAHPTVFLATSLIRLVHPIVPLAVSSAYELHLIDFLVALLGY